MILKYCKTFDSKLYNSLYRTLIFVSFHNNRIKNYLCQSCFNHENHISQSGRKQEVCLFYSKVFFFYFSLNLSIRFRHFTSLILVVAFFSFNVSGYFFEKRKEKHFTIAFWTSQKPTFCHACAGEIMTIKRKGEKILQEKDCFSLLMAFCIWKDICFSLRNKNVFFLKSFR